MPRARKNADHEAQRDLRGAWELVQVAQFLRLFRHKFGFADINTQRLEAELGLRESAPVADMLARLLRFLFSRTDIRFGSWEADVKRVLAETSSQWKPFVSSATFADMDPHQRLVFLKGVIDHVFEEKVEELSEYLDETYDPEDMRAVPIGQDSLKNTYWYFDDLRLYKETVGRKGEKWECVCSSLKEWTSFVKKFRKTSHPQEKELYEFLHRQLLPLIQGPLQTLQETQGLTQDADRRRFETAEFLRREEAEVNQVINPPPRHDNNITRHRGPLAVSSSTAPSAASVAPPENTTEEPPPEVQENSGHEEPPVEEPDRTGPSQLQEDAAGSDWSGADLPPVKPAGKKRKREMSTDSRDSSGTGQSDTSKGDARTPELMGPPLAPPPSSLPPVADAAPLQNQPVKKQPQYAYIFSTELANKAAEAVLQGRVQSIVAFHIEHVTRARLSRMRHSEQVRSGNPWQQMQASQMGYGPDVLLNPSAGGAGAMAAMQGHSKPPPPYPGSATMDMGGSGTEGLTPEQLRHRQERLLTIQRMHKLLFPEQTQTTPPSDAVATQQQVDLASLQGQLQGQAMRPGGPPRPGGPVGPGPPLQQQQVSPGNLAPNQMMSPHGLMTSQPNMMTSQGWSDPTQGAPVHKAAMMGLGSPGGSEGVVSPGAMTEEQVSAAQIEWRRLEESFYREKRKRMLEQQMMRPGAFGAMATGAMATGGQRYAGPQQYLPQDYDTDAPPTMQPPPPYQDRFPRNQPPFSTSYQSGDPYILQNQPGPQGAPHALLQSQGQPQGALLQSQGQPQGAPHALLQSQPGPQGAPHALLQSQPQPQGAPQDGPGPGLSISQQLQERARLSAQREQNQPRDQLLNQPGRDQLPPGYAGFPQRFMYPMQDRPMQDRVMQDRVRPPVSPSQQSAMHHAMQDRARPPLSPSQHSAMHRLMMSQQSMMMSQQGLVTSQQGPMMSQQGQMTSQQGPMMSQQGSVTSQQGPMMSQQGPMTSQQGPMTSQQGPVTSQQGPMTSQQGLMTSQQGPMMSQQGPMTSQQGPMTSQQGPMTSQQGPMTSQQGLMTSPGSVMSPEGPSSNGGLLMEYRRNVRSGGRSRAGSAADVMSPSPAVSPQGQRPPGVKGQGSEAGDQSPPDQQVVAEEKRGQLPAVPPVQNQMATSHPSSNQPISNQPTANQPVTNLPTTSQQLPNPSASNPHQLPNQPKTSQQQPPGRPMSSQPSASLVSGPPPTTQPATFTPVTQPATFAPSSLQQLEQHFSKRFMPGFDETPFSKTTAITTTNSLTTVSTTVTTTTAAVSTSTGTSSSDGSVAMAPKFKAPPPPTNGMKPAAANSDNNATSPATSDNRNLSPAGLSPSQVKGQGSLDGPGQSSKPMSPAVRSPAVSQSPQQVASPAPVPSPKQKPSPAMVNSPAVQSLRSPAPGSPFAQPLKSPMEKKSPKIPPPLKLPTEVKSPMVPQRQSPGLKSPTIPQDTSGSVPNSPAVPLKSPAMLKSPIMPQGTNSPMMPQVKSPLRRQESSPVVTMVRQEIPKTLLPERSQVTGHIPTTMRPLLPRQPQQLDTMSQGQRLAMMAGQSAMLGQTSMGGSMGPQMAVVSSGQFGHQMSGFPRQPSPGQRHLMSRQAQYLGRPPGGDLESPSRGNIMYSQSQLVQMQARYMAGLRQDTPAPAMVPPQPRPTFDPQPPVEIGPNTEFALAFQKRGPPSPPQNRFPSPQHPPHPGDPRYPHPGDVRLTDTQQIMDARYPHTGDSRFPHPGESRFPHPGDRFPHPGDRCPHPGEGRFPHPGDSRFPHPQQPGSQRYPHPGERYPQPQHPLDSRFPHPGEGRYGEGRYDRLAAAQRMAGMLQDGLEEASLMDRSVALQNLQNMLGPPRSMAESLGNSMEPFPGQRQLVEEMRSQEAVQSMLGRMMQSHNAMPKSGMPAGPSHSAMQGPRMTPPYSTADVSMAAGQGSLGGQMSLGSMTGQGSLGSLSGGQMSPGGLMFKPPAGGEGGMGVPMQDIQQTRKAQRFVLPTETPTRTLQYFPAGKPADRAPHPGMLQPALSAPSLPAANQDAQKRIAFSEESLMQAGGRAMNPGYPAMNHGYSGYPGQ